MNQLTPFPLEILYLSQECLGETVTIVYSRDLYLRTGFQPIIW